MSTSKEHTTDPMQRDYCNHVITTYRTLQLYGVRADTPVETDLEQLYVSLTITGQDKESGGARREMMLASPMLEDIVHRMLSTKMNPELTSLAERLLRYSQGARLENRKVRQEIPKLLEQIRKELAQELRTQKDPEIRETIQRLLQYTESPLFVDDERFRAQPKQRTKSIGEALQAAQRLVVLGEPGSGKTTLLKYLALVFASDKAKDRLKLDDSCIPVFLRFWDYAKLGAQQIGDITSLLSWIQAQVRLTGFQLPDAFLETALKEGNCILLFDGLDEVPDLKDRRRTVGVVEAFVNAYPKNRYVISSRVQGYRGIPHFASEFVETAVNPFSDENVVAFVENWYRAVQGTLSSPLDRRRADEMSQDLLRAVTANPKVRQLARNPLLLSTIALVHYNRVRLPEQRAELYDECTAFLLGFWDSSKGIEADAEIARLLGDDLDRNAKRELLEPVAFWFHEQGSEGFAADRDTLQTRLAQELIQITGEMETDTLSQVASLLLDSARERSGLLIERENGVFAFSHLTFQEYLAARHLAYRSDCIDFVLAHLHESWWEEVIRLVAGHLGGENNRWARQQTTKLIDAIRNAGSDYEKYLKRDLFLAAKCLADVGSMGVHGNLRDEVADELMHIYQHTEFELLRREAFEHLVQIGSERHNAELRRRLFEPLRNGKWPDNLLIELNKSDPRVMEALLVLLNEQDYKVRVSVIHTLGRIGKLDIPIIDALIETLKDKSDAVRAATSEALGRFGKPNARIIRGLSRLLKVQDSSSNQVNATVRVSAAIALGQIGQVDNKVVDILIQFIQEGNLHFIQDAHSVDPYAAIDVLTKLGQSDARAVEGLFSLLTNPSPDICLSAAQELVNLNRVDKLVIDTLLSLIEHQGSVSIHAVVVLGEIGQADERIMEALLRLFKHQDEQISYFAGVALGQIGQSDKRVVDALLPLLEDERGNLRIAAADILGRISQVDDRVVNALWRSLEVEDDYLRASAADVLVELNKADELLIEILLGLVEHPMYRISSKAADALSKLDYTNQKIAHALLKFSENWLFFFVEGNVGSYLTQAAMTGNKEILQMLIDATKSETDILRWMCASALGHSRHPEVKGVLASMLEDPRNRHVVTDLTGNGREASVREVAFEAMWNLISENPNQTTNNSKSFGVFLRISK